MTEFDELMVRDAFIRVKEDMLSLHGELSRIEQVAESLSLTLPSLLDKKEFYEFVTRVRAELDNLEQSLASKNDLVSSQKLIDKAHERIDESTKSIEKSFENLQIKISAAATKESLKHAEESNGKKFASTEKRFVSSIEASQTHNDKALKAMLGKFESQSEEISELRSIFVQMSRSTEQVKESVTELKQNARKKDRQIAKLQERISGKRITQSNVPSGFFVIISILALAIIALFFLVPILTPVSVNQTSDPANDQCISQFECQDLGGSQFYSHCGFNETLGNCRCDIVTNQSLCDSAGKEAAQNRIDSSKSSRMWPWVIVFIILGSVVIATILVRRKNN